MKKYMKNLIKVLMITALIMSLTACGSSSSTSSENEDNEGAEEETKDQDEALIEEAEEEEVEAELTEPAVEEYDDSNDRYTKHINNYVGRNVASVGYLSLGGEIRDSYGSANLPISFLCENGTYLDPQNEEQLKEYVVIAQMPEAGSEMTLTYQLDSNGEEYENLVDDTSYDEIVLVVKPVNDNKIKNKVDYDLTEIKAAPDKYTRYVGDYVGRNLASVGYISLAGDVRVYSGSSNIKVSIIADDGSYIEPEDRAIQTQYVVTSQSPAPNTENKLTFQTDSDGNEYSNLVSGQTVENIDLYVTKLPEEVINAQPALISDDEGEESEEAD